MAQQGVLLVYTGDGKGKTTASLGVTLRAIGRGMKVKYFQFIKSPERTYGEQIALRKLGVETIQLGIGFTWTKTPEEHRAALKKAWAVVKEALADESTSALDVITQKQIMDELLRLREQIGAAILMITHDLGCAAYMAERIIVMQHGQIVECAPTQQLLQSPQQPYTKMLLKAAPKWPEGEHHVH